MLSNSQYLKVQVSELFSGVKKWNQFLPGWYHAVTLNIEHEYTPPLLPCTSNYASEVPWAWHILSPEARPLWGTPDWLLSHSVILLVKLHSSCHVATVQEGWREDWPQLPWSPDLCVCQLCVHFSSKPSKYMPQECSKVKCHKQKNVTNGATRELLEFWKINIKQTTTRGKLLTENQLLKKSVHSKQFKILNCCPNLTFSIIPVLLVCLLRAGFPVRKTILSVWAL